MSAKKTELNTEKLSINIHVTPNAKENQISYISEANNIQLEVKVINSNQIAAVPDNNRANNELVAFLAEVLQLKKRDIQVVAGHKSRDKVVRFESVKYKTQSELLEAIDKFLS